MSNRVRITYSLFFITYNSGSSLLRMQIYASLAALLEMPTARRQETLASDLHVADALADESLWQA